MDELTKKLVVAQQSGSYMVAVWHVKDGKVNSWVNTQGFPLDDMPTALGLLKQDLKQIVARVIEGELPTQAEAAD